MGDCNGKVMDGCEAAIDLDTSCGNTCLSCTAVAADVTLHTATGTCTVAAAAGACGITCPLSIPHLHTTSTDSSLGDTDWFDCNQDAADGCETQIPCCTRVGADGPFDLTTNCSVALGALTSLSTSNLATISAYTCTNGECDSTGCTSLVPSLPFLILARHDRQLRLRPKCPQRLRVGSALLFHPDRPG